MAGPNITHTFVANTKAKATQVNDNFEDVKDWGSAIPLTDLASGSAGRLIICNASGVPQYQAASGAVAVSSAGATTIGYGSVDQATNTNLFIDGSSWQTLNNCSMTPVAGTYVVIGKAEAYSSADFIFKLRLRSGGTQVDLAQSEATSSYGYRAHCSVCDVVTVNGAQAIDLQVVGVAFGGVPSTEFGRLVIVRVA